MSDASQQPGDSPSGLPMSATHAVAFVLLMSLLLASLLSVLLEILLCKAKGTGALSVITGLLATIWCFHPQTQLQSPVEIQTQLQAIAGQEHLRSGASEDHGYILSIGFSSVTQLCPTLRDPSTATPAHPCPAPAPRARSDSCPSSH